MKKLITICLVCMFASTALADWMPGDPYKMHYPQMPDPLGWDVSFSTVLADDWQCSQTGYVKDIHFWVSLKGDVEPPEEGGPAIYVGIYADIPAVGEYPSHPGDLLWGQTFVDGQYEGEDAGIGSQGWFDPAIQLAIPNDHTNYYLINIMNINSITKPFMQERGTIYWLGIQATPPADANYEIGWKTSISEHFMDDAVWSSAAGSGELVYPSNDPLGRGGQSIDLAFVITPEPATICLLTLGGLVFLRRKTV